MGMLIDSFPQVLQTSLHRTCVTYLFPCYDFHVVNSNCVSVDQCDMKQSCGWWSLSCQTVRHNPPSKIDVYTSWKETWYFLAQCWRWNENKHTTGKLIMRSSADNHRKRNWVSLFLRKKNGENGRLYLQTMWETYSTTMVDEGLDQRWQKYRDGQRERKRILQNKRQREGAKKKKLLCHLEKMSCYGYYFFVSLRAS